MPGKRGFRLIFSGGGGMMRGKTKTVLAASVIDLINSLSTLIKHVDQFKHFPVSLPKKRRRK